MFFDILCTLNMWIISYFGIYYYLDVIHGFAQAKEVTSHILSFVHSFVISIYAYYSSFIVDDQGYFEFSHIGGPNRLIHNKILSFLISYMIYDSVYLMYRNERAKMYIVHHTLSILVAMQSLYYNQGGYELTLVVYITESTTPLLNLKYFYRYFKMEDTWWNILNDFLFAVRFLFNRLIWFNLLFIQVYQTETLLGIKLAGLIFLGLHLIWSNYIFQLLYAYKTLK